MIEHLVSPEVSIELLRLTSFLRSQHPAAAQFRDAYRAQPALVRRARAGRVRPVRRDLPARIARARDRRGRSAAREPARPATRRAERTLDQLAPGECGRRSRALEGEPAIARRLMELGLVPGTHGRDGALARRSAIRSS